MTATLAESLTEDPLVGVDLAVEDQYVAPPPDGMPPDPVPHNRYVVSDAKEGATWVVTEWGHMTPDEDLLVHDAFQECPRLATLLLPLELLTIATGHREFKTVLVKGESSTIDRGYLVKHAGRALLQYYMW